MQVFKTKVSEKQDYIPRMTGYKYSVTVSQLEDNRLLHPDAKMFLMKIQEEHTDTITVIMTQHLIRVRLKKWGTKAHNNVHPNTKKVHFRNTFKPMHSKELEDKQRKSVLESHMLLNKTYGK